MLVTFSCDAYENITLFGSVAQRLLTMMGHTGTVPGAILASDVPQALMRLQQSLGQEKQRLAANLPSQTDEDEQEVSLSKRAVPIVALLQAAVKAKCDVMWA
ncbi:MAG: DUF1840 domain-containing protein [Legionellaceae bacterium]|nr:DUF1840 domain-containing protein [Legionellaceae bacterium]